MRKKCALEISVEVSKDADVSAMACRVGGFYSEIIERRLNQSDLTEEQKLIVLERIIEYIQRQNRVIS